MPERPPILEVAKLSYAYQERTALIDLNFKVEQGAIFGFLGPNGSGKTTLFRLLSTLFPIQKGRIVMGGVDLDANPDAVRVQLGVAFQSPSLDVKLTVLENLLYHADIYGLGLTERQARIDELLNRFELSDRRDDLVENLSGGLKRRVELAKALLPHPCILLLDEPTTGLDPAARRDFWALLREVNAQEGVTILVTTHLMEEAEQCRQLLILDQGKAVGQDTPQRLKENLGGVSVTVTPSGELTGFAESIARKFGAKPHGLKGQSLRFDEATLEMPAHEFIGKLRKEFPDKVAAITLATPSLEDVFFRLTGRSLDDSAGHEAGGLDI